MGETIHIEFRNEAPPIEALFADLMREARRRAGLTREQEAQAINRRSARNPRLTAWSIAAYETGVALPVADTLAHALMLAGVDVVGRISSCFGG